MQKNEVKFVPAEWKFSADSDMTFSGYGARFGNVDAYGDVIAAGAFKKTLANAERSGEWPAMLLQHGSMLGGDDQMPVGVWTKMEEDGKGLWVEGKLADTARGVDTYKLLKMTPRPAISGLSIGYRPVEFEMRRKPDDPRRTLKSVELHEVSLVNNPANRLARVQAVKNFADMSAEEIRELEVTLREKGLSRSNAAIAVSGFKDWCQRDAGAPETDLRDEGAAGELAEMLRRNTALFTR